MKWYEKNNKPEKEKMVTSWDIFSNFLYDFLFSLKRKEKNVHFFKGETRAQASVSNNITTWKNISRFFFCFSCGFWKKNNTQNPSFLVWLDLYEKNKLLWMMKIFIKLCWDYFRLVIAYNLKFFTISEFSENFL